MAVKSNLTNMALCLTLVCLLCSAILGAVYFVTEAPIQQAKDKALVEALSLVLPAEGQLSVDARTIDVDGIGYEYYVKSENGVPVSWAIKSSTGGFGGTLTVLVGMERGGIVHSTKVLEHSETPGLGAKCGTEESFYSQFVGLDSKSRILSVSKDGGDIDAITASTITSRAYTLAVANAVKVAAKLEEETGNE